MVIVALLPPTITHKVRAYLFAQIRHPMADALVAIRQDKEYDVYGVCELPRDQLRRRVLLLVRCRTDPEGGVYRCSVSEAKGEVGRCTCQGFNRWRDCKHLQVCRDLIQEKGLSQLVVES